MFRILALFALLLACTFDDKGRKTDDCNYCGCPDSRHYGDHSFYNGECLSCGAKQ